MKKRNKIIILVLALLLVGAIALVSAGISPITPSLNLDGQNQFTIQDYSSITGSNSRLNLNTTSSDDKPFHFRINNNIDGKYGFFLESQAFQNGTSDGVHRFHLMYLVQDVNGTGIVQKNTNDGTGSNLVLNQNGQLSDYNNAIKIDSPNNLTAGTENALYMSKVGGSISDIGSMLLLDEGDGLTFYVDKEGDLGIASKILSKSNDTTAEIRTQNILSNYKNGLYLYSPYAQTGTQSFLLNVVNDHADTTTATSSIRSDATTANTVIEEWRSGSTQKARIDIEGDAEFDGQVQAVGGFLGNLSWSYLDSYPVACPEGSYLTQLDDSVTCTTISLITNNLNVSGNFTNSLIPQTTDLYSIGSSLLRWLKGWFVDLDVSGTATIENLTISGSGDFIISMNSTAKTCNEATAGSIYYNNDTNKHYGCNVTAWQPLY